MTFTNHLQQQHPVFFAPPAARKIHGFPRIFFHAAKTIFINSQSPSSTVADLPFPNPPLTYQLPAKSWSPFRVASLITHFNAIFGATFSLLTWPLNPLGQSRKKVFPLVGWTANEKNLNEGLTRKIWFIWWVSLFAREDAFNEHENELAKYCGSFVEMTKTSSRKCLAGNILQLKLIRKVQVKWKLFTFISRRVTYLNSIKVWLFKIMEAQHSNLLYCTLVPIFYRFQFICFILLAIDNWRLSLFPVHCCVAGIAYVCHITASSSAHSDLDKGHFSAGNGISMHSHYPPISQHRSLINKRNIFPHFSKFNKTLREQRETFQCRNKVADYPSSFLDIPLAPPTSRDGGVSNKQVTWIIPKSVGQTYP